jgi:hypothetical protein
MSKEKKPNPMTGLSPQERLEKYSVLFSFTTEEEIDTQALADQWGVARLGVSGMIHGAKNSKKLYEDMREKGYADDEFPAWWYSPARKTESPIKTLEAPASSEMTREVPLSSEKTLFVPTPPREPALGEGGPGRPDIQDTSEQDRSELDGTHQDMTGLVGTSQGLTEQQVALLKSRAITQITPGQWMHTRKQSDGKIVLTPVDPRMELQMIEGQTRGDAIARAQIYSLILLMNSISLIIWI